METFTNISMVGSNGESTERVEEPGLHGGEGAARSLLGVNFPSSKMVPSFGCAEVLITTRSPTTYRQSRHHRDRIITTVAVSSFENL